MIVKVGLLGATGRMGLEIAGLIGHGVTVAGHRIELVDAIAQSQRIRSLEGIPVRPLSAEPREPLHVWIDFSRPEATLDLLASSSEPIAIGTTGFTPAQREAIAAESTRRPILLAPNMSPGVALLLKLIKQLPSSSPSQFDAAITEEHHSKKKDSPSGTALLLASALEERGFRRPEPLAVRAGGTRGIHTIVLAGEEERLELRHEALDRKVFARGALLAAIFLAKQDRPGLFSMEDALL